MINCSYENFETFMRYNEKRIYRMWEHKKLWTPWEEKNCTELDTNLVSNECDFVIIRESIKLPDGDILLGMQHVYFDDEDKLEDNVNNVNMYYYKLSNISLAYLPSDQFNCREDYK